MSEAIFRIFVSSTYIDLAGYRKAVEEAINDLGQKYEGMEYMGGRPEEPTTACLKMIDKCDLFIGIYAWRYGHIPPGSEISITEQEYDYAKDYAEGKGKPCFCYIVDGFFPWPPNLIEKGEAAEKFIKFKAKIRQANVCPEFRETHDLKYKINSNLSTWLACNKPGLKREALKVGEDPVLRYYKAITEKYSTLTMIGSRRTFDMESIYIPLTLHIDQESRLTRNNGIAYEIESDLGCPKVKANEKEVGSSHFYYETDDQESLVNSPRDEPIEKFIVHPLKAEGLLTLIYKAVVILGEPGMGKTTMLHYLALKVSKRSGGPFPILVKLADFSKTKDPLETYLLSAVENYITGEGMRDAASHLIQAQKALILLDGLDEVNRDEYNYVTERIRAFVASHRDCRVIITSRKAGFLGNELPYPIFEIDKLPMIEIESFIGKWFETETDLAGRIKANPRIYELSENPFLLSIICLIFEKDEDLPQRRIELYKRCAITLLTLFDEKRGPKRINLYCMTRSGCSKTWHTTSSAQMRRVIMSFPTIP